MTVHVAVQLLIRRPCTSDSSLPLYTHTHNHHRSHSTFEGNSGTNGIVSVGYTPMVFRGTNRFIRNSGTSTLRVSGK